MHPLFSSSLVCKTITLTDDNPQPLFNKNIPFYAADMQCQTYPVKIGAAGAMDFVLYPNETYWTYNANLRDFNVMNETAGDNGKLVVIASVPNQFVNDALRGDWQRV